MDIKTLCLGLLCTGEACGYELKKQFESSFKHFYPAGFGSIYPSLADLADKGLVNCREMPQHKKPDRKVYRITDAGRECFSRALYRADPEHKLRSEYLVVAYFADFVDDDTLNRMLTDWQQNLGDSVSRFDKISEQNGDELSPRKQFVIGFGRAINQAMADYINDNRGLLVGSNPAPEMHRARPEKPNEPVNIETRL